MYKSIIRIPDTDWKTNKIMEIKITEHEEMFSKSKQRKTHAKSDRDGWEFEEIVGEEKSLQLQERQLLHRAFSLANT